MLLQVYDVRLCVPRESSTKALLVTGTCTCSTCVLWKLQSSSSIYFPFQVISVLHNSMKTGLLYRDRCTCIHISQARGCTCIVLGQCCMIVQNCTPKVCRALTQRHSVRLDRMTVSACFCFVTVIMLVFKSR